MAATKNLPVLIVYPNVTVDDSVLANVAARRQAHMKNKLSPEINVYAIRIDKDTVGLVEYVGTAKPAASSIWEGVKEIPGSDTFTGSENISDSYTNAELLHCLPDDMTMDEAVMSCQHVILDTITTVRIFRIGGRRFLSARRRMAPILGQTGTDVEYGRYGSIGGEIFKYLPDGVRTEKVCDRDRAWYSYRLSVHLSPEHIDSHYIEDLAIRMANLWSDPRVDDPTVIRVYQKDHMFFLGCHIKPIPELEQATDRHRAFVVYTTEKSKWHTQYPRHLDACPMRIYTKNPRAILSGSNVQKYTWGNLFITAPESVRNLVYLDYLKARPLNGE